jgi:hypothetical protein
MLAGRLGVRVSGCPGPGTEAPAASVNQNALRLYDKGGHCTIVQSTPDTTQLKGEELCLGGAFEL